MHVIYQNDDFFPLGYAGFDWEWVTFSHSGCAFKFVVEAVLITQGCFIFCWAELAQSRPFLPCKPPTNEWTGGAQRVWRDRVRRADPNRPKEYPMPGSAIKAGEEEGRGDAGRNGTCLSKVILFCDGAQLSWGWLNPSMLLGSSEWLLCFAYLPVQLLLYLLTCVCINSWDFQLLHTQFPLPSPCGEFSEHLHGMEMPQKSHNIFLKAMMHN